MTKGPPTARIPPLEPPYTQQVASQLARMMPSGTPPIALFRTFARNLEMTQSMQPWGSYELSRRLSLSMREREIVIDRTCARCGCEYEWGVHIGFFADRVGLTAAQISSLTHGGAGDTCWQQQSERILITVVDALHDDNDVPDSVWQQATGYFTSQQMLDLCLLTGWYHAISFAARATRVPLEDGQPTFADVVRIPHD